MSKLISIFSVIAAITVCGCPKSTTSEPFAIKLGMDYSEVESELERIGAAEVFFPNKPPRDENGRYFDLSWFKIDADSVLAIVHDSEKDNDTILSMSIADNIRTDKDKETANWKSINSYPFPPR